MRIENYNSAIQLTPDQINYALGHLGFLTSTAAHAPVFLVNEQTINEIYPGEKRLDFNEGCLKECFFMYDKEKHALYERLKHSRKNRKEQRHRINDNSSEEHQEPDRNVDTTEERTQDNNPIKTINEIEKNLYHQIETCMSDQPSEFSAIGLYTKEPPLDGLPDKPVIFICPEKIEGICDNFIEKACYATDSKSKHVTTLFTAVLLHELTHAHLKTDSRITLKPFGKVIEETLCNATAFQQFDTWQEKSLLMRFHANQPISYRGYTFWQNRDITIRSLLSSWKEKSERLDINSGIDQYLLFVLFLCENNHFYTHQQRSELEWNIGQHWYREITNRNRHQIFSYDPDLRDRFLRYRNSFQYYERLSAKI